MNILIKKSHIAITALTVLAVTACGVSGGLAGIGGSGYISTGTITSFGSVFVNGVEFNTNASTFEIEDDASLTQSDLRIGMVVEVTGSINSDGVTGTASHIKYGDDLEGPVSNLVAGVNISRFSIFGTTVEVSEVSTTFEKMSFAEITNGSVLEVSGFYDQNNVLQASYIEFKSANYNADTIFEIKGKISNLSVSDFQIQGLQVNASTAIYEGLLNGLQNGLLVEVKGKLINSVLVATKIESEDSFSETSEVEIEGIITRYVDDSDFDVNGQTIDASTSSFSPASLMLKIGIKVEVQGQIDNSVLIASEVEVREGSAAVSAKVKTKSENSFTVEVLLNQFVTVQLTTATRMKDDAGLEGMDDNLLLSELQTGDFVSVKGFESSSDTITATEVKRESEVKGIQLQGIVRQESINDFTVLGITYPVDENTSYNGADNNSTFMALTELDVSVISITDDTPVDGIASEVEIEN